jgi:hypothetical protein
LLALICGWRRSGRGPLVCGWRRGGRSPLVTRRGCGPLVGGRTRSGGSLCRRGGRGLLRRGLALLFGYGGLPLLLRRCFRLALLFGSLLGYGSLPLLLRCLFGCGGLPLLLRRCFRLALLFGSLFGSLLGYGSLALLFSFRLPLLLCRQFRSFCLTLPLRGLFGCLFGQAGLFSRGLFRCRSLLGGRGNLGRVPFGEVPPAVNTGTAGKDKDHTGKGR